ncbi:MAG: hypothetical protein ONB43_25175 [candidate division KSB1 bacterium]|nr:hypothetical protein [candidate division KSB1 bacterium]MDZ7407121.1 hypothetical protein [candidate division KSB1 bacterium]
MLAVKEREALQKRLEQAFEPRTAQVLVNVFEQVLEARNGYVTREDFRDLKQAVTELAAAQARTEAAVQVLAEKQARTEAAVQVLAEKQARTEAAVQVLAEKQARTEAAVQVLAEKQARTEAAVQVLAEKQARTEAAVQVLAEKQARTEAAVQVLTEKQSQTDEAVRSLAVAQANTEKALQQLARQVGGLSDTVGGDIEDIAYIVLHEVLKRELGWEVGILERSWQTWDGEAQEVDVFGQARDPAHPERRIWIVGEAKHNMTMKEVEHFIKKVGRAKQHLTGEVFAVCFCYRVRPEVKARIKEAGLRLVFSYGKLE